MVGEVRRLRRDVGAFGFAVGRPLADWQRHDLRLAVPITTLLWGRQTGKSRGLAVLALWAAFRRPGQLVLVVSGGGELGARRLLAEVRAAAESWEALRSSVTEAGAGLVRLSNGSEVRSVAASEGSVRGWSADVLLLDESQLIADDLALGAAFPTTAARPDARIVAAGTASVASGWFYDLCRRGEVGGDPAVSFSRRVSRLVGGEDAAPWQNATLIEAQVRAMGPLRADAEHRCVWSSGADAFVSRGVLDRVTADFEPATLCGPARVAAGVDWGWRRDRSAAVAVARLVLPGERRFAVCAVRRWEAGHPLPEVVAEVAGSPAHFHAVTPELNGLGGPWADRLRSLLRQRPGWAGGARPRSGFRVLVEDGGPPPSWEEVEAEARRRQRRAAHFRTSVAGVHLDARLKAGGYGSLRRLFEEGALVLPASEVELRRELLGLRVTLTESGERIEGASDDLADALMLALCPTRFKDGSYGTRLGMLTDERRRLPGPRAPAEWEPGEQVETTAGVRVPRAPAWQSIEGPEVTVPGAAVPGPAELEQPIPLMRRAT